MNFTHEQIAALRRIADLVAEIVSEHPEGIPGGHLYAPMMANISLDNFNAMMRVLVEAKLVTKRGEVYYPVARTVH